MSEPDVPLDDDTYILTDEAGRPIPRPHREDYASLADYAHAYHWFNTRVATIANRAFTDQFRRALSAPTKKNHGPRKQE